MKRHLAIALFLAAAITTSSLLAAEAIAVIQPTQGHKARGVVTFTKVEHGVRIVADLQGLTPGTHGFHIHEYGDISDPKARSCGSHFNPHKAAHGSPSSKSHHLGDLGNIQASPSGNAHLEIIVDGDFSLSGENSIIGRSVVVHQDPDDLKSQPAGNSGARVGMGVIGVANPSPRKR